MPVHLKFFSAFVCGITRLLQLLCAGAAQWQTSRIPAQNARGVRGGIAFLTFTALVVAVGFASASPVRVVGRAQLELGANRSQEGAYLHGSLRDDSGAPIAEAKVHLKLRGTASASAPLAEATAITDKNGAWWSVVEVPLGAYELSAAVDSTDAIEAASASGPVDLNRIGVYLEFEDRERAVRLDDQQLSVRATAREWRRSALHGDAISGASGLSVRLRDEAGKLLGEAVSDSEGGVEFHLRSADFAPGEGELRLDFEGDSQRSPARQVRQVTRVARVKLRVTAPDSPQFPETGIALAVDATWAHGRVDKGTLEAYAGALLVGAVAIAPSARTPENAADRPLQIIVKFGAHEQPSNVALRVHYRASEPAYEPGSDALVELQVRGPSAWRHLPLALAAAGVLGWLVLGRIRRKPVVSEQRVSSIPQRAAIQILKTRPAHAGYIGFVRDGHDGEPVAHASIRVLRCSFDGEVEILQASTDLSGAFALPAIQNPSAGGSASKLDLVADAALYASHRQALPEAAELAVFLVTRRRNVLARFVSWARGRVAAATLEPSPLTVARLTRDPDAKAFAMRVAEFVYSADSATAAREAETLAALPTPGTLEQGARARAIANALAAAEPPKPAPIGATRVGLPPDPARPPEPDDAAGPTT